MPSPRCVHEQASIICFGLPCWGGLIPYRTRYNRNEHLERIAFKQLELKRAMHTPRYGKLQHSALQNLFQIFCIFYRLGAINFCVDPISNLLLLFCAIYIVSHKFGIFVCLFVCWRRLPIPFHSLQKTINVIIKSFKCHHSQFAEQIWSH